VRVMFLTKLQTLNAEGIAKIQRASLKFPQTKRSITPSLIVASKFMALTWQI